MLVTIRKNEYDEYECPTAFVFHNRREVAAEIYYTDDIEDGKATVRHQLAADGNPDKITFRVRRGTYGEQQ